jgi:hypothetical protein
MIQSHDELIMEMTDEYGLNRMGENNDDEDDNDEGNTITHPAPTPAVIPRSEIDGNEASIRVPRMFHSHV